MLSFAPIPYVILFLKPKTYPIVSTSCPSSSYLKDCRLQQPSQGSNEHFMHVKKYFKYSYVPVSKNENGAGWIIDNYKSERPLFSSRAFEALGGDIHFKTVVPSERDISFTHSMGLWHRLARSFNRRNPVSETHKRPASSANLQKALIYKRTNKNAAPSWAFSVWICTVAFSQKWHSEQQSEHTADSRATPHSSDNKK